MPTTTVLYPASEKISDKVQVSDLKTIAASPCAIPVPYCLKAYPPVNIEKCEEVQVADELCQLVNLIPVAAGLSVLGVLTFVVP